MEDHVRGQGEPYNVAVVHRLAAQEPVTARARLVERDGQSVNTFHHALRVEDQRVVHQDEVLLGERTIVHHDSLRHVMDGYLASDVTLRIHAGDLHEGAAQCLALPARVAEGPHLPGGRAHLRVRGEWARERASPRGLASGGRFTRALVEAQRERCRAFI